MEMTKLLRVMSKIIGKTQPFLVDLLDYAFEVSFCKNNKFLMVKIANYRKRVRKRILKHLKYVKQFEQRGLLAWLNKKPK